MESAAPHRGGCGFPLRCKYLQAGFEFEVRSSVNVILHLLQVLYEKLRSHLACYTSWLNLVIFKEIGVLIVCKEIVGLTLHLVF